MPNTHQYFSIFQDQAYQWWSECDYHTLIVPNPITHFYEKIELPSQQQREDNLVPTGQKVKGRDHSDMDI